jgi:hypothetical protein
VSDRRPWLCLPALVCFLGDVAVTLAGQPDAYWGGDRACAVEANPVARWLLLESPWLFLGVAALWAATFTILILRWRHPFAAVLAFLLTLFHAVGIATWVVGRGVVGVMAAIAILLAAERLFSWAWGRNASAKRR